MPPGKTLDVLCLFRSFLFFFKTRSKSTFLCLISSKMCHHKRTKKIMIFVFFDLIRSSLFFFFFFFFFFFCRISLKKCPQTENKNDHAAGKIARCPLSFLLLYPPPPPQSANFDHGNFEIFAMVMVKNVSCLTIWP